MADTLSRAPLAVEDHKSSNFELFRVEAGENELDQCYQLRSRTMQALQKATREDKVMQDLMVVIATGWPPNKDQLQPSLTPYWCFRDELTLVNGMVFRGL